MNREQGPWLVETARIMGTVATVLALPDPVLGAADRDAGDAEFRSRVAEFVAQMRYYESVFSPFDPDSAISRLASNSLTWADAPPEPAEVAALCEQAKSDTGGRFDAWRVPDSVSQDGARGRRSVPYGTFNPTGLIKGWAVDSAFPLLEKLLGSRLLAVGVNLGGDIRVATFDGTMTNRSATNGTTTAIQPRLHSASPAPDVLGPIVRSGAGYAKAGGAPSSSIPPFRIGIQNPVNRAEVVTVFELANGALATSGIAERGLHIVVPDTGLAATSVLSATVLARDLTTADIWATTAVSAGFDDLSWLGRAPIGAGLVIAADGRVRRWIESPVGPVELVVTETG